MTPDHTQHYDYVRKNVPVMFSAAEATADALRSNGVDLQKKSVLREIAMAVQTNEHGAILIDAMARYNIAGRQTFVLGPKMRDAFVATELSEIRLADVKFPYSAFYVAVPNCLWQLWGGPKTQWHDTAGFYVAVSDIELSVVLWGPNNSRSQFPGDDATAWFHVSMENAAQDPVEDVLTRVLEGGGINNPDLGDPPRDDLQKRSFVNAIRCAVNLALYLSSENPDTQTETPEQRRRPILDQIRGKKNPGKIKALQRRLDSASTSTVTVVGPNLERQLVAAERVATREGRRMFIRRGHWHGYWTGSGRTTLVRKWIQPHYVNADADQTVDRTAYVLREDR